jgi:hypothetical protein
MFRSPHDKSTQSVPVGRISSALLSGRTAATQNPFANRVREKSIFSCRFKLIWAVQG